MWGVGAVVVTLADAVAGLRVVVAGFLVVVGARDVVTCLVEEWTEVEEVILAEENAADDDGR